MGQATESVSYHMVRIASIVWHLRKIFTIINTRHVLRSAQKTWSYTISPELMFREWKNLQPFTSFMKNLLYYLFSKLPFPWIFTEIVWKTHLQTISDSFLYSVTWLSNYTLTLEVYWRYVKSPNEEIDQKHTFKHYQTNSYRLITIQT